MADKVMRMIEPTSIGAAPAAIQRECAGCQEEEEETIQTQSAPSLIARRPAPGVTTRPIALQGAGERAEEDMPLGQTAIFRKAEFAAPQTNAESASPLTDRLAHSQAGGEPLPALTRQRMENAFGYDFSRVRVHRDAEAVEISQRLSAHAFTHGSHIYFSNGMYDPGGSSGKRLLAHELTHVLQQAGTTANKAAPTTIQRKEVENDSDIKGPQDWTTADRESKTKRWQDACLTNLNAVDSSQYVKVVERRDFYKWFYEYCAALGYNTRWALAAYVVANGAHQIVDMDVDHSMANDVLGLASVEFQGAMREGNQVIFDNVLPKLKKLLDGGPLKGPAALKWDMQVLAEEQTLIQPMYSRMSPETLEQLNYIAHKKRFAGAGAWMSGDDKVPQGPYNNADTVPGFDQPDIKNIGDRWKYGMRLGDKFTPGGTGFDPNQNPMPAVGAGYQNGSEFARVDTRAHLHQLDAWLNPNRMTRMGPGSTNATTFLQTIINNLSESEKLRVLYNRSPDGWYYSTQFAQFSSITEAMVKQALPSDPSYAGLIAGFMWLYNSERKRVQVMYPTYIYMGP